MSDAPEPDTGADGGDETGRRRRRPPPRLPCPDAPVGSLILCNAGLATGGQRSVTGSATLPLLCKHATELPHLIPPPPPAPCGGGGGAEKAAVTPGPRANAAMNINWILERVEADAAKNEGLLRVLRQRGGGRQRRRGRRSARTPPEGEGKGRRRESTSRLAASATVGLARAGAESRPCPKSAEACQRPRAPALTDSIVRIINKHYICYSIFIPFI